MPPRSLESRTTVISQSMFDRFLTYSMPGYLSLPQTLLMPWIQAPSGGAPSAVQLGPRLSGYYSEALKVGGGKLNVGVTPYLSAPLSMGYNPTNGLVYYDLSNQFGNPFPQYRNTVTPSNVSCKYSSHAPTVITTTADTNVLGYKFNCAPNDELCYSNGKHIRVQACQAPTSLTMRVCA